MASSLARTVTYSPRSVDAMRAELHCLILLTIFSFTARDIPLHSSSSRDVVTGPSARFRFINYARMRRFSDPGRGGGAENRRGRDNCPNKHFCSAYIVLKRWLVPQHEMNPDLAPNKLITSKRLL